MSRRKKEKTIKDTEKLMEHVERSLSEIEQAEFINGYTDEELVDSGLIGNKDIEITRSKYSTVNSLEDFKIIDTIDYMICTGYEEPSEVSWKDYGHLINVAREKTIAVILTGLCATVTQHHRI